MHEERNKEKKMEIETLFTILEKLRNVSIPPSIGGYIIRKLRVIVFSR